MAEGKNYALGKGRIFFAPFDDGTTNATKGEFFLGNASTFKLTASADSLEHYSSTDGVKELDDYITTTITRSGSIVVDNIVVENIGMYLYGDASQVAQATATVSESIPYVYQGRYYQIGVTDTNPSGAKMLASVAITGMVEGTDYTVDLPTGRLYILAAVSNVTIAVSYTTAAASLTRVITSSDQRRGALRFVAHPPKGNPFDYFMPCVNMQPDDDMSLIGDDWLTIGFKFQVLKLTNRASIYVDGRPQ